MSQDYDAGQIEVLEGLEAVKVRPAMYIGSTDERGLHHLVWEIVDNSVDEHIGGFCDKINVTITPSNGIIVEDNGRGIPTEIHPTKGVSALQVALTELHAGGKFGGEGSSYKASAGLHGVGSSCVNALSTVLKATVFRKGVITEQIFHKGIPDAPAHEIGTTEKRGTTIFFQPDPSIFKTTLEYNFETLEHRIHELAFLNPTLTFVLADQRIGHEQVKTFSEPGGVAAFAKHLDRARKPILEVLHVSKGGESPLDLALTYNEGYTETLVSFVNNVNTWEGGTHVAGFRSALTRAINKYAPEHMPKNRKTVDIKGEDMREGLTAVISIKVNEPQFEGQTKRKLGNSEVKSIVEAAAYDLISTFFEEHPSFIKTIVEKAILAADAREEARKSRERVRAKSTLSGSIGLPGKLSDCTSKNPAETEVFLAEGDSAAGGLKMGRDRYTQAVLALKGKILNSERTRLARLLENDEINSIVGTLGCGMGDTFDIEKLRYHKIILGTDADDDGSHIQCLVLTLFYRFLPELIKNGHLYIVCSPLYKIKLGKVEHYAYDTEERDAILESLGEGRKSAYVQRYKGLGEMNPDQLSETILNKSERRLQRITIEDAADADDAFSLCMGEEVDPRKEFIMEHAADIFEELDI